MRNLTIEYKALRQDRDIRTILLVFVKAHFLGAGNGDRPGPVALPSRNLAVEIDLAVEQTSAYHHSPRDILVEFEIRNLEFGLVLQGSPLDRRG